MTTSQPTRVSTQTTKKAPIWGCRLFCLPALVVLTIWAVEYGIRSWSVVTFPYGFDYGESPELERAMDVAVLRPLYTFWNAPPYHMASYTPLYALLNGFFVRLFGVQYQSGRAIAWVSSLLFCAALAWLAWRESRRLLAPAVTALLWCSAHYVWDWTSLGREDDLAMLFGVAGLVIFYEGYVRRECSFGAATDRSKRAIVPTTSVWIALVLFLAAVYTRQSTVEATLACGIYLLFRRPRLAAEFVAIFLIAGAFIFSIIDILTRGAFFLNVILAHLDTFRWSTVVAFATEFWQHYQVATIIAAFYVLCQIASRGQCLFVLYGFAAVVIGITAGKDGSAENYVLVPWGAICLLAGLGAARLEATAQWLWSLNARPLRVIGRFTGLLLWALLGAGLLLQAQLTFHLLYTGSWSPQQGAIAARSPLGQLLVRWTESEWYRALRIPEPSASDILANYGGLYEPVLGPSDRGEQAYLDSIVAATPGDVIDEDMTHLLLAGKRIYIQPFEFTVLAEVGRWNQAPYVQALQQKQFKLIITTTPMETTILYERYTPQMVAAIANNYCLDSQTTHYYVYRPCG